MTQNRILKIFLPLVFGGLIIGIFIVNQSQGAIPPTKSDKSLLATSEEYADITSRVLKELDERHYQRIKIDNTFSEQLYKRYLEQLDSSRSYLLADDIKSFNKYIHTLDDSLLKTDLEPAFVIFNRFQQRRIERQQHLISLLEKGIKDINFTAEEFLEIDRKESAWLKDKAEADELWRKRLKNDVLNLKQTGKKSDEIAEILGKRYTSQLHRIQQTNSDDVFQTYMDAFTPLYDPHTRYFSPRESENFDISMRLSLQGIGALLQSEDDYTKVLSLVPAGPAEKSNLLKPADRIVGVAQDTDGEMVDVVGWRLDDVVDLIRGPKDSIVRLNIIPNSSAGSHEIKEIKLTRDTIKLEEQAAQKKIIEVKADNRVLKIGVLQLPTFYIDFEAAQSGDENYKSSSRDAEKLINELKQEGIDGLVIDLRNNGGGALQEANSLTGLFIRSGPIVQVRSQRNHTQILSDRDPRIAYTGPLAVLVNRLSASASEIFAGAIQDTGRGIVVGSQTFGKGTVQTLSNVEPGKLKFTESKFYRISGASTQNKGIIPDIILPEIYDSKEIGESAEPNALIWDTIKPARYFGDTRITQLLNPLQALHEKRVKTDTDFIHLTKKIQLFEKSRSRTTIPLNEAKRLAQKNETEADLLALENSRRKMKGEKQLANFKELESIELEKDEKFKNDALLMETAHIVMDLTTLQQSQLANQLPKVIDRSNP